MYNRGLKIWDEKKIQIHNNCHTPKIIIVKLHFFPFVKQLSRIFPWNQFNEKNFSWKWFHVILFPIRHSMVGLHTARISSAGMHAELCDPVHV